MHAYVHQLHPTPYTLNPCLLRACIRATAAPYALRPEPLPPACMRASAAPYALIPCSPLRADPQASVAREYERKEAHRVKVKATLQRKHGTAIRGKDLMRFLKVRGGGEGGRRSDSARWEAYTQCCTGVCFAWWGGV